MSVIYNIEITDTFGGEANYCWVKRGTAHVAETHDGESHKARELRNVRAVCKRVRELAGWPAKHYRLSVSTCGDEYTIRPRGLNQVAFATCEG